MELEQVYRMVNQGVEMPRKLPVPKDKINDDRMWRLLAQVSFELVNATLHNAFGEDYQAFGYQMPTRQFYLDKTRPFLNLHFK